MTDSIPLGTHRAYHRIPRCVPLMLPEMYVFPHKHTLSGVGRHHGNAVTHLMHFGTQRRPGCCTKNKSKALPQAPATVGVTFIMEAFPEEPQKAKTGPVTTQGGENSGRDEGWEEPILHLMQAISFSYKTTVQGFSFQQF